MKQYILVICLFFVTIFSSCRKESLNIESPNDRVCNTYEEQFEAVWEGLDHSYLFWDYQSLDWDSIREVMLPRFKAFDQNGATDDELSEAYYDMVGTFIDHHFSLQVRNLQTNNRIYVSPGWNEVSQRAGYHYDFTDYQVALLPTMEGVSLYKEGNDYCPCWFALFPGNDGKKIAYLRLSSFSITNLLWAVNSGEVPSSALLPLRFFYGNDVLDGVTNGRAGQDTIQAVIIDVRGNGGGNAGELIPLVGSLTPSRTDFGYSRHKEGLGRLDYSAWTPFYLDSHAHHLDGSKPVVVLADCNSASCSEMTAFFVQNFPHGTFIGERTFGATCPLLPGSYDMLYSGVFGDYNQYGYYAYTSNFVVADKNYEILEGKGVTPDIECPLDFQALMTGHDNQLERALQYLRTGK